MNIQLKVHVKNGSTQLINVPMKKEVAVMVPQPKGEVTFELVDLETQLAPQRVFMKRVGNDLHIFIDEDTHVDVVIKDYYENEPLSPIMGVAEDGILYPYLAESNLLADSIPHLTENVLASQVLGGEGVAAALLPFSWTPFLYGLAGVGLVAALLGSSSGGSGKDNIPVEITPTLDQNGKLTGGLTIQTDPKAKVYRIEFYPEGSKNPVTIVYERQPDGSLKLVTDTSKLNVQPPATIAAGQPIELPADLLKDNAPVKVQAEGDNAAGSATMVAPYDKNTEIELDPVVGIDRDGDGKLDAAVVSGKTSPNAVVEITDKDGNKIAETIADDEGNFSVPVALDPKNQNSDGLEDLTVTATKPGENPASTSIPEDKYPTELEKPNDGVNPDDLPPTLTPEQEAEMQPSDKPTINTNPDVFKAIDESRDSDLNPETVKVEGTAPANSKVTLFVEKDGKAIPVATVTASPNGSYKISASDFGKDFDLLTGDNIYVVATEAGKKPTSSEKAQIPAVENGPEGHPYDSVRPEQPTILTKQSAGDGSAKVVADKLKANETLHIKLTDENDNVHHLTFTLNDKGQLEQVVDANNPTPDHIKFKIDGKTVLIDENSLKDDHPVQAYVSDLAENHSPSTDAWTGFDEVTERNFEAEITAIDTDSPANTVADKVNVKLKGDDLKVGDTAIITDDKGNVLGKVTLTEDNKNDDGSFSVEVPVNDGNKPPKTVSVAIQEPGKDPTAPITQPLPPVASGEAGHPNDKTPPTKPTLDQNEEGVAVNFNPENTDKLVIEVDGNPVVTYTKDPETGVLKSDNPAKFPDIPAGKDSVNIPRDQLPETGKISATASDLADNEAKSDEADLLPIVEQLPPVEVSSVIAVDTSESADKNPEEFIITGKAEKGSIVIARDANGTEIGRTPEPVGEDGTFTITVREKPSLDITRAPEISLVQDQENKRESKPVNPPEATELRHTDNLPPAKPEKVELGNNDVGLAIDPTSNKVTIDYTDKDGNKKTAELVRQPDGSLKSNDPNVIVEANKDDQGRDIVRIPSDKTTPNTLVTATAEDLVPNKSGKTQVPTRDNAVDVATGEGQPTETTAAPVLKTIVAKDTSNPADKKAELITVSGTTEPNALVVVKQGDTVLRTVKANASGEFSDTFSKPNGTTFEVGEKITATATAPNKLPSGLSNELAVPETTLFDDSVPPSAVTFGDNADGKVEPNGDIKANLPTEDIKPGDKVVFTITPKDPTKAPQVVELTKRDGDGWESSNPDVIPSTDDNTVTIPDASTPTDATVTAVVTDLAGNESDPAEINAGRPASGKPSIDSITAYDTSNPADRPTENNPINPEMFKITGKAPAGATVIAKDKAGNILGSTKADQDGNFVIEKAIESGKKDLKSGDPIYVEAIEEGKLPTPSDDATIPAVVAGAEGQIGDRTPPAPTNVTITPEGNGEIELPKDAQPGDKVKGEITKPDGSKTPIEIVKGEDGNWTAPNNPNVTIDKDNGKATIPSSDLPAGSKVEVHSEDPIGNKSADDEATVPQVTATPTIDTIKALDSSDVADNDPEKVVVTGTVAGEPAGTVVTLKTQDGKVIGSGVIEGDDGKFTITGVEKKDVPLNVGDFVKVSAQAPSKSVSPDSALKEIPAVAAGKEGHEDRTLPDSVIPTGEAEDKKITNDQEMTFDVPKTDVNTIEVLVKPANGADSDKPVKVVLTKNEDGGFTSDNPEVVPNVPAPTGDNAPKITIPANSVKPNTTVEVTTVDLADNRGKPVEVSVTTPASTNAAENKVEAPTFSAVKSDQSIDLLLPKANEKTGTVKVVLVYEDEKTGERSEVVFKRTDGTKDDWTVSSPADYPNLPTANAEGVKAVTLPEALVKDGSKIFAYGSNENGSIVSETVETTAAIKEYTQTPTEVKVIPVDTSDEADNTPEKVRFTGKVTDEPEGTLVEIKDASGNIIATTRTDKDGNFSVDVPADKKLGKEDNAKTVGDLVNGEVNGNNIKVVATAPNKGESPSAQAGQVTKGDLVHTDTTAPDPVILDSNSQGDVIATLPTAAEGDKAIFTLMPKDATAETDKKTVTYTKQGDKWVKDNGSNVDGLPAEISGNTLTIPAAQLPKNNDRTSVVEAQAKDLANNQSTKTKQEVAFTNKPTIESIDAIDTSYESDTNPEKFVIKGKVEGEAEGTVVTAKDQEGNIIGTGLVKADGSYEIPAQETPNFDIVNGSTITVTANATGKVSSEASDPSAVNTANISHEETVPPSVELTRGEDNVVTATVSGDTKEISVKVGDEVVTAKRDPETGNISESSNEALLPNSNNGTKENPNTTFTINAGEKPVEVTATDLANNKGSATNEPTPAVPELPQTMQPTELAVKAIDTSNPYDDNPEKFIVTGKTSPNAKVEVKDNTGKVIGTGKADEQGNFTVTAVQNGHDVSVGENLTVQATAPNHRPSETATVAVPAVAEGKEGHEGDRTGPNVISIERENPSNGDEGDSPAGDKKKPDVIAKVDNDAKEVKVCVGDDCATLTRQEDGSLKSDNEDLVPSTKAEDPNTIRVPGNVADGKTVTVTPIDGVGNEGEPAVLPPVFVPEKPALEAKDDGSVEMTFPADAREGDKVVLTYQPNPTEAGGDLPAREKVTFTKQPDGSWKADKEDVLPEPKTEDGVTTVTIPADKVKDETPVSAYSENRENTGRTEAVQAEAGIDGDGAKQGDELTTTTPTNLTLAAVDTTGDNDPEQFTLTGDVAGEPDGTVVTVKVGDKVVAEVPVKDGKFTATFTDPADANINVGSQLSVTAKADGKKPSAAANKEVLANEVTNVATPVQPVQPAHEETTKTPEELKLTKVLDTSNPADGNPEKFVVTGKVPNEEAGVAVQIRDAKGNLIGEGETKAGGVFEIEVTESPSHDLKLNKEPADSLSVTATAPNKNPSAAAGLPLVDPADNPVAREYPNDNQAPEVPTVTASPDDGSVKVKLPQDAVAGDKVTVTLTPTGQEQPVEVVLTKNPDGSWTSSDPKLVPNAIDDQEFVTIPESAVRDGKEVTAKATDLAGNESAPSTDTAGNDRRTNTPVELKAKAIDLNEKADANPEKVVITGRVPDEKAGTHVFLLDAKGKQVAETTIDDNGNFTFTLVENTQPAENHQGATFVPEVNVGDSYRVQARAEDKLPSLNKPEVAVPAVPVFGDNGEDGQPLTKEQLAEFHPNDKTEPTAPTVTAGQPDKVKGDGSASIGLPPDAVDGDKVIVTFTPEDKDGQPQPEQTLVVTKTPEGWTITEPADALDPAPTIHGNTLTLPEELLKDGEPVKAKSQDNAGKESGENQAATGKDEAATTPSAVKLTPIGEGESADLNPEGVKITGKGKPGETIEVLDKDGNNVGEVKIPEDAKTDENGLADFEITVKEPKPAEIDAGTELTLKATHPEKAESDSVTHAVPAMQPADAKTDFDGNPNNDADPEKGNHTGDETKPNAPKLAANEDKGNGSVTLTKPEEPTQVGDRIEVKLIPESAENDEPVIVTLTKQPDGSWESDNALVPSIPANENSVEIPENSLKDGKEVKARTVDVAGNPSEVVNATAGNDDITATPFDLVAKPFDTSNPADVQADVVLIQGKTDPNAEVSVMKDGVELFKVTADASGAFSVLAYNANADKVDDLKAKLAEKGITAEPKAIAEGQTLSSNDALTFKAKHPQKDESDVANHQVGELANGKEQHPFDSEAPKAPAVTAITEDANGKEKGAVEVDLQPNGNEPKDGDKVTISYTKEDGTPATAVFTYDGDAWTADPTNDPAVTLDNATNKVTIAKGEVKDNTPVYAQTTDLAGNASEKAHATAAFEQETPLEVKTVRGQKAPGSQATDTDPEVLTVSGKTDAGAEVTVKLVTDKNAYDTNPETGVVTLKTTADKDGNFTVTFEEGKYPLTKAGENGKAPNEIVQGNNVMVTAELVGKKAPSAETTKQVPSTRTMFVESTDTDVVDKGSANNNANTLNANISDNVIDEVKLTGKVEKDAKLKVRILSADGSEVIAEKEFDNASIGYTNEVGKNDQNAKVNSSDDKVDSGDFSVTLTKADLKPNKAFAAGQKVEITAMHPTETSIGESSVEGTALPALVDGATDHPEDKQATALENSAISFSHSSTTAADDGKTHATINLPTEADVKKLTVTFNDESGTEKKAVFTRKADGGWAVSTENGENTAGLADIPASNTTLAISHDKLNGGSDATQRGSLKVKVEDIAGQSKDLTQAVPEDKTTALSVTTTTGQDTSPRADKVAESITITGTATEGATVTLVDASGTPITKTGGGNITATATGGNFTLTYNVADVPEDKRENAKLSAKADGHQTSAVTDFTKPEATTHTEKNKPEVSAKVEDSTSAVRFTMKTLDSVKDTDGADAKLNKLADGDVLTLQKDGENTPLAKFKYDNGAWTPVDGVTKNAGVDAPVAIKGEDGKTVGWYVDVKANNGDLPQGTTIKATLTDIAGNIGEAQNQLPNPDHIDVPKVFVGSRTMSHPNDDVKDADRLEIPASNEPQIDPNAGDIWIKPGADNTLITIKFVKAEATIDPQTGEFEVTTIYGVKTTNGWALSEDQAGNTPVTYGSMKVVGGEQHLQINASAVRDKSEVSVVASDGVNSTNAMKVNGKVEDNTKYVETDFDDSTETVKVKSAVQTDKKIAITPEQDDAIMHITEFQTSGHFGEDVAAAFGLAPTSGKNYLVAVKQPKQDGAGNEWKLGFIAVDADQLNDPKAFENFAKLANRLEQPHAEVATIDPTTGVVTLNATMVQHGSKVKVGYVDAYGRSGMTSGNTGDTKDLTVNNDARETPVYVDAPEVQPLGNGLVQVTAGQVDTKKDPNDPNADKLDGSNFKTLIDVDGNLDVASGSNAELILTYNPSTGLYEKANNQISLPSHITIVDFDPKSGTVTLKSTQDGVKVSAVAYKTPEGSNAQKASEVRTGEFNVKDPFAEEADQPQVKPELDGGVEIKPGADNKKIEVSYTDESNAKQKATLTLNNGTWTSDRPQDFEITSGKIKLKNDKVKDGTEVSAVGFDGNTYPADYDVETLRGQPVKSEPHTGFALANDNRTGSIDTPTIAKDTQDADDKDVLITRGADNNRMEIKFTPVGKDITKPEQKMTIIAKLEQGGEWSLKYEDGSKVEDNVAVLRSPGVVELKKEAIAPTKGTEESQKSKVSATGYDNEGLKADATDYSLPQDQNGSSQAQNQKVYLKITGDGQFEGWTSMQDANRTGVMFYAFDKEDETFDRYILRVENGQQKVYKFPATPGAQRSEVSGATFTDFGATYESNQHKIKVDSSTATRFLVMTDSPKENLTTGHDPYRFVQYSATADRNVGAESYSADGYLPNNTVHDYKPFDPAEPVQSVAPDTKDTDNQGGMRIEPHDDHTRLEVKYTRESGAKVTALLEKDRNGNWVYTNKDDYPTDFILNNQGFVDVNEGAIRMHFDAVRDQSTVSVRGGQSGKRYSASKEGTSQDDRVIQPTDSGLREELATALTNADKKLINDVEVRNGTIRKGKESSGFTELKDYVLANGGSVDIDKTTVVRNFNMKFGTSKGHAIMVEGSLGDTLAAGWGALKGKIFDANVTMTDHNDILALQNDLGENDTKGQMTRLNMGGGHDVLTVGGATRDFVLVEDFTSFDPKTRYRFEKKDGSMTVGNLNKEAEISGLENASLASSVGGRIHYANVNMGEGNDLVIVEGFRSGDPFAIDASTINLGSGNDVLLTAPNGEDNRTFSDRGTIGNSVIDAGDGDDYIDAVGADAGAKIFLGNGNDHLVLTRMEKDSTLVDAGSGDDIVHVKGEVRGGAKINLGNGDDVFIFGGSQHILFGKSGTHALFEGDLDGGRGYDVVKLNTPNRTSLINQKETNLSTNNMKGIEEVWLSNQTSIDIYYKDLVKDGPGPLKIRGLDINGKPLTGKAVVDLGGSQVNGTTDGNQLGSGTNDARDGSMSNDPRTWTKFGEVTELGVTYNVYEYGGDSNNQVWIEQNVPITVI